MKCFVGLANYMQLRTNRLANYAPINIDCKTVAQAADGNVGVWRGRCDWIAPVLTLVSGEACIRQEWKASGHAVDDLVWKKKAFEAAFSSLFCADVRLGSKCP